MTGNGKHTAYKHGELRDGLFNCFIATNNYTGICYTTKIYPHLNLIPVKHMMLFLGNYQDLKDQSSNMSRR